MQSTVPHSKLPDEEVWKSYFDLPTIRKWIAPENLQKKTVIDLLPGHGVLARDLAQHHPQLQIVMPEARPDMVDYVKSHQADWGLPNLQPVLTDPTVQNRPLRQFGYQLEVWGKHILRFLQTLIGQAPPQGLPPFSSQTQGIPLGRNATDCVIISSILHAPDQKKHAILSEAYRVLRPGGKAYVISWKPGEHTPRQDIKELLPTPTLIRHCAAHVGLEIDEPYTSLGDHLFGMVLTKPKG